MIYITGDTHGKLDIARFSSRYFPSAMKLTKSDYLIICGDFGAYMYGNKNDEELLDFWESQPYTVLFLDGNHENFNRLEEIEVTKWNGGKVQYLRPSVIHLMRGQIYTIEGKKFFVFGGAKSIDKSSRIENISWWAAEEANYAECEEALANLETISNSVDYILTHAAPEWIKKNIFKQIFKMSSNDISITERFLDEVLNNVKYDYWFCGHYHKDFRLKDYKFEVLYKNIIKLSAGMPVVNKW